MDTRETKRRSRVRIFLAGFGFLLTCALLWLFFVEPSRTDRKRNAVHPAVWSPSAAALSLHETLFVADLHSDALLWKRSLLKRNAYGHTDLPRLRDGNVSLQVFSAVTRVPRDRSYTWTNESSVDLITPLAIFNGWPPRTYGSPFERAIHQASRLMSFAKKSDGQLIVITNRNELDSFLASPGDRTAALLAIEGMHVIGTDPTRLRTLYDAGYRMMSPTHFFDTAISGSAHGRSKSGLTEFGKTIIKKMDSLGITIDVSHVSESGINDILDITTNPVVASHGGVDGTCNSRRNLPDDLIWKIAENGGVIGIGLWEGAICGRTPADFAAAVMHVVHAAGVKHVGLGSDFDGNVHVVVDASNLAVLTDALTKAGLTDSEIADVMGENVKRVLLHNLPRND